MNVAEYVLQIKQFRKTKAIMSDEWDGFGKTVFQDAEKSTESGAIELGIKVQRLVNWLVSTQAGRLETGQRSDRIRI